MCFVLSKVCVGSGAVSSMRNEGVAMLAECAWLLFCVLQVGDNSFDLPDANVLIQVSRQCLLMCVGFCVVYYCLRACPP